MTNDFGQMNLDELMQETNRLSQENGMSSDVYVKMPPAGGFTVVRLFPPAKGRSLPYVATRIHKVNKKNFHCHRCLTKTAQGKVFWRDTNPSDPCHACKYISSLWDEMRDLDKNSAKHKELFSQASGQGSVKAYERYYYACIVRKELDPKTGEVKENVGPKILPAGVQIHDKIIRALAGNPKLEEPPIRPFVTDFVGGRDLKIINSGDASYPDYTESKFIDPAPLGTPDQIKMWVANMPDLDALRTLKPNEELKLELQKHLGVIKDDSTSFNKSEFQKSSETLESQIARAAAASTTPTVAAKDIPNAAQTEAYNTTEFMAELEKLKAN